MPTRRSLLPLLMLPLLPSAKAEEISCCQRGGALIVHPRRPAAPLSAQLDALVPLVHHAALGLALQAAWHCFTPNEDARMRSTLAWALDALRHNGFGEVRSAELKSARRRGGEEAARLIAMGAKTEAARAMQASLRHVFAREPRAGKACASDL